MTGKMRKALFFSIDLTESCCQIDVGIIAATSTERFLVGAGFIQLETQLGDVRLSLDSIDF